MASSEANIVIPRTWRSELITIIVFVVMSILAVVLSRVFPWSVIEGELFSIGGRVFWMRLPLFWFVPLITIGSSLYRIYNVRYVVNERGVECETGILALQRRLVRIWFEDIRSVQTQQSLLHRFLGVGDLEVGTAATGTVEVILKGIAAPEEVQEMLQRERDKRQKSQHFEKNAHNKREEQKAVSA